jgi:hypothetical protein
MDSLGVDAYEVRESYVRFKLSEYQPTTGKCLNFRHLQLLVYFCGIFDRVESKAERLFSYPQILWINLWICLG